MKRTTLAKGTSANNLNLIFHFMLLLSLVFATASTSLAQIIGGECIEKATGLNNPSCTANDVRISQLEVISGPTTCSPGETLDLTLRATIESGPARFDIGIWLNETGGSALSDDTGTCYRNFLSPIAASPSCNQSGGPYLDGDGDVCGDVPATSGGCTAVTGTCSSGSGTCTFTTREFDISLICNDSDDDGRADVGTCTSWDNNENTSCNSVADAKPGTGSKCNCEFVPIGDVFIDPCADVVCTAFDTSCGIASCDPNGEPGNCNILTPKPSDTLCRESVGECDADDFCDGTTTQCPVDRFQDLGTTCGDSTDTVCNGPDICDGAGSCVPNFEPDTTQCRADAGACDVPEFCDGQGNCPADGFEPAGSACGSSSDTICDNPDQCDGSGFCLENNEPITTQCRADSGECDVPEFCDGVGSCPSDGFEPSGTSCGSSSDTICDNPDTCSGSGACQPNNEPATTECRADAGECDVPELCDGAGSCPADGFESAGTACGDQTDSICDNPDACDGSGICEVNNEPATTECRADTGECDVPELCDGAGSCPADGFESAGTACGDQTDSICDNPDACDGLGGCEENLEPTTTSCRADAGDCDREEFCDGLGECPADVFEPDGTSCTDNDSDACTTPACLGGACNQESQVVSCVDPTCERCNPETGSCILRDPPPAQCVAQEICRTPGFYGTHADDVKKNSQDITGELLLAAGGAIQVCGITLNNTEVGNANSALEALCVNIQGTQGLQLVRHLTSMTLNCLVSGGTSSCSGLSPDLGELYGDCTLACTGDPSAERTISQCVSEVDCFNNGGEFINGTCFLGVCSDNGEFCNSNDISACEVTFCDLLLDPTCQIATCGPIPGNCHDNDLCLDAESLPNLCFEPTGPAGSNGACNKAIKNNCVVTDASTCAGSARSLRRSKAKKTAKKARGKR